MTSSSRWRGTAAFLASDTFRHPCYDRRLMIENFRCFQGWTGPFSTETLDVDFRWQQNGISIPHADTEDVKYPSLSGRDDDVQEKVVALSHPILLKLFAVTFKER